MLVGLPDGPRPLLRQHRGGVPILVSDEASRWLQQRCATAGGGEDHWQVCCRGSSDGESCVREDRRQLSSSIGDLSGGLVSGMKHGLELGDCALRLPQREENLLRGNHGV
jgi:hypothetical protein